MKTDNELIAEFMGAEIHPTERCAYKHPFLQCYVTKHGLEYHSEWSWLMPVVERIYRLREKEVKFKLENSRARIITGKKVFSCHTISSLNSTYACVVDFIKWYNSQTNTPSNL